MGSSNKAIATELGVSVATVERHLTNVYRKLDASGRADAAVKALSANLLAHRFGGGKSRSPPTGSPRSGPLRRFSTVSPGARRHRDPERMQC